MPRYRFGRRIFVYSIVYGGGCALVMIAALVAAVVLWGGVAMGLRKTPPGKTIDGAVEMMLSTRHVDQGRGLALLRKFPPDRRRRDVSAALRHVLQDEFPMHHAEAVELLGDWGNSDDLDVLQKAATARSPSLRNAALEAIRQIEARSAPRPN